LLGFDEGQIAWIELDESWTGNLYLYDIPAGKKTQVAVGLSQDEWMGLGFMVAFQPILADKKIIWYENDGNDTEIFLYDSVTKVTTQITDNETDDYDTTIGGNHVVWISKPTWGGYPTDLYAYNIVTGETTHMWEVSNQIMIRMDGTLMGISSRSHDSHGENIWFSASYHNLETGTGGLLMPDPPHGITDVLPSSPVWVDGTLFAWHEVNYELGARVFLSDPFSDLYTVLEGGYPLVHNGLAVYLAPG
jgi:hypothetical protein